MAPFARVGVAALALLVLSGCRAIVPAEEHELDGAVLLGARHQQGWENEDVPVMRVDGVWRRWQWPVGVRVSSSLSGYAGDMSGEQSVDLGLGLVRWLEIGELVHGALGAGYAFVATHDDDLFDADSDSWQTPYLEGGLYVPLVGSEELWLGLETRWTSGEGPELGGNELDGEWLDLYLVVRVGLPGQRTNDDRERRDAAARTTR